MTQEPEAEAIAGPFASGPRGAILSIQSAVVAGHVGHNAAEWAIAAAGLAPWRIPTTLLSHHPGHGPARGRASPPEEIEALIEGLAALGALREIAAFSTGYLARADQGGAIVRAREAVRAANPQAFWLLDPVIGDLPGGSYVAPEIAAFFEREALPRADLVTPNRFELEALTALPASNPDELRRAAEALLARGPRAVVVTSAPMDEGGAGVLVASAQGAWRIDTPRLDARVCGAGDLFAGALAARLAAHREDWLDHLPDAAAFAASATHAAIAITIERRAAELAAPAATRVLRAPPRMFAAEPLR